MMCVTTDQYHSHPDSTIGVLTVSMLFRAFRSLHSSCICCLPNENKLEPGNNKVCAE